MTNKPIQDVPKNGNHNTEFQRKPIPWMYSTIGSFLSTAVMKLHPTHRYLTELEIKNIQDYFNSRFVPEGQRKNLAKLQAFFMCYWGAIQRINKLSKKARQDYFALNRRGCFNLENIEPMMAPLYQNSPHLPLLIVPGLNTPAVFFREMMEHFKTNGYNVSVMHLPEKGFADVETASFALASEIDRLKACCNVEQINVVGHCLGGLVSQYFLANQASSTDENGKLTPIKNLITLGTGFSGADGVAKLKNLWMNNHPDAIAPRVFDQLIQWNITIAHKAGEVAYHNFLTVWDFIVHHQKAFLEVTHLDHVKNYIFDDPDIDHLTLALNPKVFARIETALNPA